MTRFRDANGLAASELADEADRLLGLAYATIERDDGSLRVESGWDAVLLALVGVGRAVLAVELTLAQTADDAAGRFDR